MLSLAMLSHFRQSEQIVQKEMGLADGLYL